MKREESNKSISQAKTLFRFYWILVLLLFAVPEQLMAQRPTPAFKVKAGFLYNFTQFVDWPPSAFNSADTPFIIGIMGDEDLAAYMEELVRNERIGERPIQVRRVYNRSQALQSNMLFIDSQAERPEKEIFTEAGKKGILTVGDSENFTRWGGIIRFYTENSKIRFEINTASAQAAKLRISSKLLSLAKIYRQGE